MAIAWALVGLCATHCVSEPEAGDDSASNAGTAHSGSHSGGSSSVTGGARSGGAAGSGNAGSNDGGTAPTGGVGGAAGDGTGGDGGETPGGAGPGGAAGLEFFSVASFDGYLRAPPPACTTGFVDFGCDERLPLDCDAPDEVISFDSDDQLHCPYCAAPPAGEPALGCLQKRVRYGDFLTDLVSASCANHCDSNADCFGWEIRNACGTFVMSLMGGIDEEPLDFAREYAATHCSECGTSGQTTVMRRPGSEPVVGTLLEDFEPQCVRHQCVLARER